MAEGIIIVTGGAGGLGIIEYPSYADFPVTGESGYLYLAADEDLLYRWDGSSYRMLSSSLTLGETSSTAYRGDRGKIAYDHSQVAHAPSNANYYEHPLTHPPSIILQDASNRFITDVERSAWNAKSNLVLGETSSTAYRGDRGKVAYDHSQIAHAPADAPTGSAFASHTGNADIHITSGERTAWNAKQDALGFTPLNANLKGAANGLAELDASGTVPSSQLPSYVDDVLEYDSSGLFPATGESGKIYIDKTYNKTYRWSGTQYSEISASIALGETSNTAYRGDRGKIAYDHSQVAHAPSNANYYEHPATHPPSIIAQDASNRFVTDAEKSAWTAKQNALGTGTNSQYLRGDGTWATPPDTTYSEITEAEITTGTASTLKAITARRLRFALDNQTLNGANLIAGSVELASLSSEVSSGLVSQSSRDEWSGKQDDLGTGTTSQYLRGDGVWATPPDTTYAPITDAEILAGTSTISRAITAAGIKYAFNNIKAASAANADTAPWTGISGKPAFLALGETSTTAYRGDRGKIAYDHSQVDHAPANANYYVHPSSHPATMITQDTTHRFVTDTEKSTWNAKSTLALGTTSVTAFRGDQGLTAYNHSQTAHAPSDAPSNATFTAHTGDGVAHITGTERSTWNAKSNLALGTTSTTAYRGDHGLIAYNHAGSAHAPSDAPSNSTFTGHTSNAVVHITAEERSFWNASAGAGLTLGETDTTAYRGDRGKTAYDYSQIGHLPLAGGNVTGLTTFAQGVQIAENRWSATGWTGNAIYTDPAGTNGFAFGNGTTLSTWFARAGSTITRGIEVWNDGSMARITPPLDVVTSVTAGDGFITGNWLIKENAATGSLDFDFIG